MFRNYFITALRLIRRPPLTSLINITGLALGIASALLILLYVHNELSFDRFHEKLDRIYRASVTFKLQDQVQATPISNLPMGPEMTDAFPEIENFTRFSTEQRGTLTVEKKSFKEVSFYVVDSTFFDLFSFRPLAGNPGKMLAGPSGMVITASLAKRLFGSLDPLGREVMLNDAWPFTVEGIVADPPSNSTIQFDFLIPMKRFISETNPYAGWDGGFSFYTFFLLMPNCNVTLLEAKFPDYMYEKANRKLEQAGASINIKLDPFRRIHLHSTYDYEMGTTGTITRTLIFSFVALVILLMACFNYINLTTARATERLKEVGIRKVVGSSRVHLIGQFTSESVVLTLVAGVLALLLVELLLPWFNNLSGQQLSLSSLSLWILLVVVPLSIILLGILASSYPSFYLSSFQPVLVIKGMTETTSGKPVLRNILVVVQNLIAAVLLICTLFIFRQNQFMMKKDLGLDKEQVLVIPMMNKELQKGAPLLKEALKSQSGVVYVGMASETPGYGYTQNGYMPEGLDKPLMFYALDIDEDFLPALNIGLATGENFSGSISRDSMKMLINESLAKQLGWTNPVGKYIERDGKYTVIGVVKDFHFQTLHHKIAPLVITSVPGEHYYNLLVKLSSVDAFTVSRMEKVFNKLFPQQTFSYFFLDEQYDKMYRSEKQFGKIFLWATLLAVLIASLGLLALAIFAVDRKVREIGIRKAMGARPAEIMAYMIRQFSGWVLLSNLLAYPIAWYFMRRWLQGFEYRIGLSAWIFLLTTLITLVIAFAAVGYQAYNASRINPAESLKYE
jgi:putative ABC transport system permease protein